MGRLILALLAFAAIVVALRAARGEGLRAEAAQRGRRRWPWEIIAVALVIIAVFGLFWRRWFDT
jgi:hypothetical protein